jgi:hypothetical protein
MRLSKTKTLEWKGSYSSMEGEYVVGWGTLALINAGLAQGKGKSGLLWFFLSLLLGPVATFWIVAFTEKEQ